MSKKSENKKKTKVTDTQIEAKRQELLAKLGEGECEDTQIKMRHIDGEIQVSVVIPKGQLKDYFRATSKYLADCAETFIDFNEKHPGIKEVHFFTSPTYWEEEEE